MDDYYATPLPAQGYLVHRSACTDYRRSETDHLIGRFTNGHDALFRAGVLGWSPQYGCRTCCPETPDALNGETGRTIGARATVPRPGDG